MRHNFFIFILFLLQACTPIDDFMLGKDNTPTPLALSDIHSKVHIEKKWSLPVSQSAKASTYLKLRPFLQGDVIYVASAHGSITAVHKKQGSILWSKTLGYGVLSGPRVAQGYIALGLTRSRLLVLRQDTGAQLQLLKVSGDVLSEPLIADNMVIAKTVDGYLYAFDLKTGEKRWATEHGSPSLILKASASPVLMGSQLLVGYSDGKLDGVDVHSGRIIWQRSIAYATGASDVERLIDIDADPIVRGDTVFLASYQGYIGALSMKDGQFIWRKPASIYKNMAIDANTIYVTDNDDILWAFNRENGQVKWKQLALKARGLTEPVLLGNHLVLGDRTGYVHILSTQNGEMLGRMALKSPVDVAPVVDGHTIYVVTANGQLSRLKVS